MPKGVLAIMIKTMRNGLALMLAILLTQIAFGQSETDPGKGGVTLTALVNPVTLAGFTLTTQIKDSSAILSGHDCVTPIGGTNNYCTGVGALNPGVHNATNAPRDDVPGADGVYGTGDDCLHCSYYCAPAAILMCGNYYQVAIPSQDFIYDQGKSTGGGVAEITANSVIETHGVGMYDGGALNIPPLEIDASLTASSLPFTRYDTAPPEAPMTFGILQAAIDAGNPVIWTDHPPVPSPPPGAQGWPEDMNEPPVDTSEKAEGVGHTRVVTGYDDKNTADPADDEYLVHDPWPNAVVTKGANPYWAPTTDVLPDPGPIQEINDVFYEIVMPDIDANPTTLLFTEGTGFEVDVEQGGSPTTQVVMVSNVGTSDLTISNLAFSGTDSGDFSLVSPPTLPLALSKSANQPLTVQFDPQATQRTLGLSASLDISSDDPNEPVLSIPITGDAVPIGIAAFWLE